MTQAHSLLLKNAVLKTFLLVLIGIGISTTQASAQGEIGPKNSLYLELGGNAIAYSINYDRILSNDFSGRIGVGFFSTDLDDGGNSSIAMIPIMANYLLGSGNSRLELGAGVLIVTGSVDVGGLSESDAGVAGTATFAYRFQKPQGGVFFKAGFTPIFYGGTFVPWFGLSIGYTL